MDLDVKYRPRKFDEVCGNETVIALLKRYIQNKEIPNVIIFNGLSGCGKTTLAYILAKTILCESEDDDKPCGKCEHCIEIENSLYRTGAPTMGIGVHAFDMSLYGDESEYIKNVCNVIDSPIMPGRKRVILLEELHITQNSLQEKLDRALEYVQENVYVIICTTNIKKIAAPIRRRSSELQLSVPSREAQLLRLRHIANLEHKPQPDTKLRKIIEISENNPARSVKNLGVILKAPEEGLSILFKDTEKDYESYLDFFDAIKMGVIGIIEFIESIPNPAKYITGLQEFIYTVMKLRYYTQAVATPELRKKVKESMRVYSDKSLMDILRKLYNIGYCSDSEAKRQLLLIGYDTNPVLFDSISQSDTLNSLAYREDTTSDQATFNKLKDDHFGLKQFDETYNKAMGITSVDDL